MESLTEGHLNEGDWQRIVDICNQPAVKKFVSGTFATGEQGMYTLDDAKNFVRMATQDWMANKAFVYLIRDDAGQLTGAINIKSANKESAEIGYWADTDEGAGGFMTNAVLALSDTARSVGFQRLTAKVRADNPASQGVLARAGFVSVEAPGSSQAPGDLQLFVKTLAE